MILRNKEIFVELNYLRETMIIIRQT